MIGWLRATFRAFREESEAIARAQHADGSTFTIARVGSSLCWHCGQPKGRHLGPDRYCRREDLDRAPWSPGGRR